MVKKQKGIWAKWMKGFLLHMSLACVFVYNCYSFKKWTPHRLFYPPFILLYYVVAEHAMQTMYLLA